MKLALILFLILPLILLAQKPIPRFASDTLYTSSGYKIYKGQELHIATGTGRNHNFRFISADGFYSWTSSTITVTDLYDYEISPLGNVYIKIRGNIIYHDGSKGRIKMKLNFDKAIEAFAGLPSELTVPDEFKNKQIGDIADQIAKLYKLYQDSVITKDEYEAAKKKLLSQ